MVLLFGFQPLHSLELHHATRLLQRSRAFFRQMAYRFFLVAALGFLKLAQPQSVAFVVLILFVGLKCSLEIFCIYLGLVLSNRSDDAFLHQEE